MPITPLTARLCSPTRRSSGLSAQDAEQTNGGLFKVPLADGSVVRTHGPDARMDDSASLVAGGPSDRFMPGSEERAPICATDHSMQVLYARTAATPDAFAASVPTIRSTVRRSNHVLNEEAIASGGGGGDYKVVCSGGEVDVKQFTTTGTSFSQVVSSAQSAGYTSSQRNYVVFLDSNGGGVCGVGSLYFSDSPALSNPHNTNGGYSVIYNGCWSGTTFMHEVGHNRGAVQPAAPELDRERRPLQRRQRRHVLRAGRRQQEPVHDLAVPHNDPLRLRLQRLLRRGARARRVPLGPLEPRHRGPELPAHR